MTSGQTIYLIDDDSSARTGLARLMRIAGYSVLPFESGKAFLSDLTPKSSGCIVMDLRMPEMTGEELLQKLHEDGLNLPVILMSADDSPALRKKAQKLKAAGFFRKPVDGTALLDAIDWALRSNEKQKITRE
jgi:FixJ family two-component response regulator